MKDCCGSPSAVCGKIPAAALAFSVVFHYNKVYFYTY
jgi:hypothetical protein